MEYLLELECSDDDIDELRLLLAIGDQEDEATRTSLEEGGRDVDSVGSGSGSDRPPPSPPRPPGGGCPPPKPPSPDPPVVGGGASSSSGGPVIGEGSSSQAAGGPADGSSDGPVAPVPPRDRPAYDDSDVTGMISNLGMVDVSSFSTSMKLAWLSNHREAGHISDLDIAGKPPFVKAVCAVPAHKKARCCCMVNVSNNDPQAVLESLVIWLSQPGDRADGGDGADTLEDHQAQADVIKLGYGMKPRRRGRTGPAG